MCPGSDTDAWSLENRVPLFPGKRNVWIFARVDDSKSSETITDELYTGFGFWFDEALTRDAVAWSDGRVKFGDADNIKVLSITPTLPPAGPFAKRREDLKTIPTIAASKVLYVALSFDYRGMLKEIPWPIYSERWYGKGRCPNDSDWVLLGAEVPKVDAEPERDAGDVITDLGDTVTDASEKLKAPFYTLAVVASILGVAYILSRLPSAGKLGTKSRKKMITSP
jgi:hypothetical protein